MNVNQVLDIYPDPSIPKEEMDRTWLWATDSDGRAGYLCLPFDKYPAFAEFANISHPADDNLARATELLLAESGIPDFSSRPLIEDASPALQNLFDQLENSDFLTYFDKESNAEWENIGLSREEYEKQIDDDIQKFGLDGIVCKHNDEDALYTCYGDFLCHFAKSGGKDLSVSKEGEEISGFSSIATDSGRPLVSVNFLPVPFQWDKEFPFRICQINDRSDPDISFVAHVVIREGKEVGVFVSDEQKSDHSYFSALDYIASVFHDDCELASEFFDGEAYAKLFYNIGLFSNPPMRLQYNPMALDAQWKEASPEYSTGIVFGKALLNGEMTVDTIMEIESDFNDALASPEFKLDDTQLARLDALPPVREACSLLDNEAILDSPSFIAAQYEWEKERTSAIFQSVEKELVSFLSTLDEAMQQHGPTRAALDCFSEMFNDLCYRKADKLQGLEIFLDLGPDASKGMEACSRKCHEALGLLKDRLFAESQSTDAVIKRGSSL